MYANAPAEGWRWRRWWWRGLNPKQAAICQIVIPPRFALNRMLIIAPSINNCISWCATERKYFASPFRPSLKCQRSVRLTLTGHAAEWKNSSAHNAITARHRPDIIQQVSRCIYWRVNCHGVRRYLQRQKRLFFHWRARANCFFALGNQQTNPRRAHTWIK